MRKFGKLLASRRSALTALSLILICSGSTAALAQVPGTVTTTADPGRVTDRLEDQTVLPDLAPRVQVRNLILQDVPDGAENIKFTLKNIKIDGEALYDPSVYNTVTADRMGQTISLADVYEIATALTNSERNNGYILTQIIVPPQTIDGGSVTLQVVEGYIDNVNVEGTDDPSAIALVRRYASKIKTGQALNVSDLERYLLLISDLPGMEARSVLSPSTSKTGAADLDIIVSRDPYDALLSFDNYGSRYLGHYQLSGAGSLNSFFGNNERITGQIVVTPEMPLTDPELAYVSLSYDQPIGTDGTSVNLFASHTDTEPGFDLTPFDVEGKSQYLSASVSHPFIRARTQNLSAYAKFDWRDLTSSNNIQTTLRDRIRTIRVGGRYEFMDTALGVGINALNVELSRGLNIFGASDNSDANLTRGQGDPQFKKITADVQRLQRVSSDVNLLVAATGQWSPDPLLSSEEFGVGGVGFGRGFDSSEIIGEVELQWDEPHKFSMFEDYQLFGFYDTGRIWNKDATANSQKTDTVSSTGFGLRADFINNINGDFFVAFPLNRDVQTQGDQDPRLYFSVRKGF